MVGGVLTLCPPPVGEGALLLRGKLLDAAVLGQLLGNRLGADGGVVGVHQEALLTHRPRPRPPLRRKHLLLLLRAPGLAQDRLALTRRYVSKPLSEGCVRACARAGGGGHGKLPKTSIQGQISHPTPPPHFQTITSLQVNHGYLVSFFLTLGPSPCGAGFGLRLEVRRPLPLPLPLGNGVGLELVKVVVVGGQFCRLLFSPAFVPCRLNAVLQRNLRLALRQNVGRQQRRPKCLQTIRWGGGGRVVSSPREKNKSPFTPAATSPTPGRPSCFSSQRHTITIQTHKQHITHLDTIAVEVDHLAGTSADRLLFRLPISCVLGVLGRQCRLARLSTGLALRQLLLLAGGQGVGPLGRPLPPLGLARSPALRRLKGVRA